MIKTILKSDIFSGWGPFVPIFRLEAGFEAHPIAFGFFFVVSPVRPEFLHLERVYLIVFHHKLSLKFDNFFLHAFHLIDCFLVTIPFSFKFRHEFFDKDF